MPSSFVTITVATPRKCSAPRATPSRRSLTSEHLDGGREAGRIHLLGRRREQHVGPGRGGQLAVAQLVTGVALEVAALVELRRVDEQRDDDDIAGVARVRISERWPSCSAPIVGTRPTRSPSRRAGASSSRSVGDRAQHPHREAGVEMGVLIGFRSSSSRIPARLQMCCGVLTGPSRESPVTACDR